VQQVRPALLKRIKQERVLMEQGAKRMSSAEFVGGKKVHPRKGIKHGMSKVTLFRP
jgi:hypothetical protein